MTSRGLQGPLCQYHITEHMTMTGLVDTQRMGFHSPGETEMVFFFRDLNLELAIIVLQGTRLLAAAVYYLHKRTDIRASHPQPHSSFILPDHAKNFVLRNSLQMSFRFQLFTGQAVFSCCQ